MRQHDVLDVALEHRVGGAEGSTGLAGIAGVLVTALVAGLLFRLLGRSNRRRRTGSSPGER